MSPGPPSSMHHSPTQAADDCKQSLLSVIESQIVPQLVQAHADQGAHDVQLADAFVPGADVTFLPSSAATVEFAHLCCANDEQACLDYVARLIERHTSVPSLLLNLITPAARYLGELWVQDRLDFSHVTMGLLRMQNITHRHGFVNRRERQSAGEKRRVLLAAAPGSQHLLGLAMVSEFFVMDGWDVTVEVARTEHELLQAVRKDWFELVGLSVGLLEQLKNLPVLVSQVRRAARNPALAVMLGGAAFTHEGTMHQTYGADTLCTDLPQAIAWAAQHIQSVQSAQD